MNKFVKKLFVISITIMLILITGFIIENLIHEKRWKTSSVASVNGEVITVEEIMPGLSSHRAEILDYFYKKYGVIPDVDFWETRFEGEVPAEMLKKNSTGGVHYHQVSADSRKRRRTN